MKICLAFIVGTLGFCLIQNGCGNANTGNHISANKEIASASFSPSPDQMIVQNSNAMNNGPSKEEVRTEKDTNIQNSSRKFGQDAIVDLPNVKAKVGSSIVVPVKVNGLANKGAISYEFDLKYDSGVIQPLGDGADLQGTISQALSLVTNKAKPGLLRVVVYGAMPIDKDGVLLNLKFTAVGASGSVSQLSFERIMFNEGDPRASTTVGQVTLVK